MTETMETKDFKLQIENDSFKLIGKHHAVCLGLTYVIYNGNIRIPCEIVEEYGLVEAVETKVKYVPWLFCRMFIKGLKIAMIPKQSKTFINDFLQK